MPVVRPAPVVWFPCPWRRAGELGCGGGANALPSFVPGATVAIAGLQAGVGVWRCRRAGGTLTSFVCECPVHLAPPSYLLRACPAASHTTGRRPFPPPARHPHSMAQQDLQSTRATSLMHRAHRAWWAGWGRHPGSLPLPGPPSPHFGREKRSLAEKLKTKNSSSQFSIASFCVAVSPRSVVHLKPATQNCYSPLSSRPAGAVLRAALARCHIFRRFRCWRSSAQGWRRCGVVVPASARAGVLPSAPVWGPLGPRPLNHRLTTITRSGARSAFTRPCPRRWARF